MEQLLRSSFLFEDQAAYDVTNWLFFSPLPYTFLPLHLKLCIYFEVHFTVINSQFICDKVIQMSVLTH